MTKNEMTENETTDLNPIEELARDGLATRINALTHEVGKAHGWQPDEVERRELTAWAMGSATNVVLAWRHPDARPPTRDELHEACVAIALTVFGQVAGSTPDFVH